MNHHTLSYLLIFYGLFLISSGIIAVIFIGLKAKTALISGGSAGGICLLTAYLISIQVQGAQLAGLVFSFALFIVFAWRATKTLFSVFAMITSSHEDLKGKGIAFLIISLMAVISIIVFGFQIIFFQLG